MDLPNKPSNPGPVIAYLATLEPDLRRRVLIDLRSLLNSGSGPMLLEVLHKAVLSGPIDVLSDASALAARNAQGFIATDLQRIASDEFEKLAEERKSMASARRTRRGDG